MFFNEDILFRNGPLALVWMAGVDGAKKKKNRKELVRLLGADLGGMCDALRKLFPEMGTSHGVPLKKMGTLAKGMGVIYFLKLESLAREVTLACSILKKPATFVVDDVTEEKTGKKGKAGKSLDLVRTGEGGGLGVVEQQEEFGDYVTEYAFGVFPSPRRVHDGRASPTLSISYDGRYERLEVTPPRGDDEEGQHGQEGRRKRARGENEDDVLQRLHLMLEGDDILLPQEDEDRLDRDIDLGDALEMLNGVINEPFDQPELPVEEMPPMEEDVPAAAAVGPPSNIVDSRVPETPAGRETHPENVRNRRNQGQDDGEESVMELGSLEGTVQIPRRGRQVRRRLRLQVDESTVISFKDMLARVEGLRKENDYAALQRELTKNQAPGRLHRKILESGSGLDFIMDAGRPCGKAFNQLKKPIVRRQREEPQHEVDDERQEAQRSGGDGTTLAGIGVSNIGGAGRTAVEPPTISELASSHAAPIARSMLPASPPIEDAVEELQDAFEDGVAAQLGPQPEEEMMGPGDDFLVPEEPPRRRANEQAVLTRRLGDGATFGDLYPPQTSRKGQAARGFLLLMKMQGKKVVSLKQEESFGEIDVEKI